MNNIDQNRLENYYDENKYNLLKKKKNVNSMNLILKSSETPSNNCHTLTILYRTEPYTKYHKTFDGRHPV